MKRAECELDESIQDQAWLLPAFRCSRSTLAEWFIESLQIPLPAILAHRALFCCAVKVATNCCIVRLDTVSSVRVFPSQRRAVAAMRQHAGGRLSQKTDEEQMRKW